MTHTSASSTSVHGASLPARSGLPASELLIVCTGNAARSVMAGFMLESLGATAGLPIRVVTAGTHSVDGQPMGMRTREALAAIPGMGGAPFGRHRSRQLDPAAIDGAHLVIGMEADHVRFVRRHYPEAAGRTATLRLLARELPAGPAPLPARVAAMGLGKAATDDTEDVADPAGGDEECYRACAEEIWQLTSALAARL